MENSVESQSDLDFKSEILNPNMRAVSRVLYILKEPVRRRGFHLLPEFVNRLGEGSEFLVPHNGDVIRAILFSSGSAF